MAPLAWVKRITSKLPELQSIPLFGNAPAFDWKRFSNMMATTLGTPHIKIDAKQQLFREPSEIKKGLGTNVAVVPIAVAPLGTIFWMMSNEDIAKLTSSLMKSGNKSRTLSSEILQEGFYRFLLLETLNAIQPMPTFEKLTLQISEEEEEGTESGAFCVDVEIDFDEKKCWGRLAIPNDFRTSWVQHFSSLASEYVPTQLAQQTMIGLGVKTASLTLSQEEWDQLKAGDFVLLDHSGFDPHKGNSVATLMLESTPLFNVKIKQNKLEVIDYAFYYEENMEDKKEEAVALKELPIQITVEIGRLKMTLDQLMHLNPGNTLELPIQPDQGVSLTVNGQKIGQAELIYLGEQLGLRILQIG